MTRMLTEKQTAAHLGQSVTWLRRQLKDLEANGFPKIDPIIRRWDLLAIDAWLDQRMDEGYSFFAQKHALLEADNRISRKIAELSPNHQES